MGQLHDGIRPRWSRSPRRPPISNTPTPPKQTASAQPPATASPSSSQAGRAIARWSHRFSGQTMTVAIETFPGRTVDLSLCEPGSKRSACSWTAPPSRSAKTPSHDPFCRSERSEGTLLLDEMRSIPPTPVILNAVKNLFSSQKQSSPFRPTHPQTRGARTGTISR